MGRLMIGWKGVVLSSSHENWSKKQLIVGTDSRGWCQAVGPSQA